jgi:SPP1 gp7 family putative phage head morphogenesis protein
MRLPCIHRQRNWRYLLALWGQAGVLMPETVTEIPKALFDATVQMQIRTGRYASKTVRDIIGLLNQADADILRKIAATDAPFTKARLAALLKEIRTVTSEIYDNAGTELKQQMLDFAGVRADQTAALIATQLPVNYNIIQATAEQLKAIVDVAPVTVGPDKKLLLEEIFASLSNGKEEAIRGAIRLGLVQGETVDEMVRRIKGTKAAQYKDGLLEVHRRHAESIVRTVTNHVSNQAMQATFKNNADVVKGWVFTATLDSRVSLTCSSLSGTVWPIGEGPVPPRHPNCRSIAVPELKTWREMGFDMDEMPAGMRSSKDGLVSSDISFSDWLKGQDKGTQVDILGKTRAELFRSGKMTIDRFADDMGRVLTLDQLKTK